MKTKMRKLFLFSAIVSLILCASACTYGLGEKVDAEAPEISISYPPEGSIIRDSFIVSGTCTDDKGISSVYLTLRLSNSKEVIKTVNATVRGTAWSVTLNDPVELTDGKYTIEAYAKDGAGHKSKAMASYDIDNTPPCLIISKPLAVAEENPTVYGQTIKIAGDISEEHKTSSLVMYFQQWDSVNKQFVGEKKEISVTDFSTMDAENPLIIAKYYSLSDIEAETDESVKSYYTTLRNRYFEIYGESNDSTLMTAGDKTFYTTIQLSDNAKEYKNPEDDGAGSGNVSEVYYINSSEFYSDFVTEDTYSLTATKLRKILNGTDKDYSAEQKTQILSKITAYELSSKKEDLSELSNVFLVNPENNPVYSAADYSLEEGFSLVNAKSLIPIRISAGRDSVKIKPENITVTVYKMENESDRNTNNKSVAAGTAWKMDFTGTEDTEEISETDIYIEISNTTVGDGTYTDSFFSAGEFYIIKVSGSDIEGSDLISGSKTGYGFQILSTSNPPSLTLLSENDEYISGTELNSNGKDIEMTVTTAGAVAIPTVTFLKSSEDSPLNHVKIYKDGQSTEEGITVTNVTTNTQTVLPVSIKNINVGTPDSDYKYPVTITLGGNNSLIPVDESGNEILGKFKYTFVITVSDSVAKTASSSFSFYVNNVEPKIQNVKLTPVESNNKVNGKITFSANATTNYEMESVSYKVFVGDSETPVATGKTDSNTSTFGSLTNSQAMFDTAADAEYDGKALKIEITAIDKVGNSFSSIIEGYTIDQASDLPTLTAQNFTLINAKNLVSKENGNVFDKNSKLIGSFADTDGVSSASYIIKKENGDVYSSGNIANPNSALFNIPAPTTAGLYQIFLTAFDSTYDEGTEATKQYRTISKDFWIAVDNTVPSISLKTIDGSEENLSSTQYKNANTVVYAGTVLDDWTEEKIEVYVNDNLVDEIQQFTVPSTPNADGSKNWTYSLSMENRPAGEYSVRFKVLDKAGKSKDVSSVIKKDIQIPVFGTQDASEDKPKPYITTTASNQWYKDSSIDIKGFVEDSESPIASVEYSLNGTTWSNLNMTYVSEENRKQVIYSGTVVGLKNGSIITLRAKDAAGNTATTTMEGIKIDTLSPSVAVTKTADSVTDNVPNYVDSSDTIYVNNVKDIYIKGSATDSVNDISGTSGVNAVYLKLKAVPTTTDYDIKADLANGEWSASYTAAAIVEAFGSDSTSGTLYALVTDKAGNTANVTVATVIYDITYPSAIITKAKYYGTENSLTTANKKVTFEGTASDNQAIQTVYLEYSLDNVTWTKYGASMDNANNWSITVNTEDPEFTDNTVYYFRATAVDIVGNIGNSGTTSIDFDVSKQKIGKILQSSDIPVITFSNISFTENMSAEDPSWLRKTNDMFVSATDDDGVEKIEYTIDNGNNWIEITNGKIHLEDNSYTVKFRVTDKYSLETPFTNPVLKDENGIVANTTGTLYLSIDKTPPVISDVSYFLFDGSDYPASGVNTTAGIKFGGILNKLKISCSASDQNGITSVKVIQGSMEWNGICEDSDYKDSQNHTWNVTIKDDEDTYLKDLTSGTYEFTLRVTDKSSTVRDKTFTLNIDNTPAAIAVTSHNQDELVGTDFVLKGTVEDADTKTSIRYVVDKNAAVVTDWNAAGLADYTGTIASWRINVDGATADDEESHTKTLKNLFMDIYGKDSEGDDFLTLNSDNKITYASGANAGQLYTTIQPIYFHLLTKDTVGNIGTATFRLKVDPQGDLPTVKMTYPVATNVAENSVTLSGPIRAQGEADTVGSNTVMGIYMQIDPNYSTSFNENLWKKTAANNPENTVVSPSLKGDDSNPLKLATLYTFENVFTKYNGQSGLAADKKKTETETANNEYGIYVGNKTSWNITINNSGELNGTGNINTVAVRLLVVDSAGNITKTEPLIITIDSDAPIFGSREFYVYQFGWVDSTDNVYYTNTETPKEGDKLYTDSGCRNVAAGKTYSSAVYTSNFASEVYSDDMSLKGEWWLSGSVDDDSDIYKIVENSSNYQIVLKDNGEVNGSYTADTANIPESTVSRYTSAAGNHGFIINLRVGSTESNSFGKLTYTLKAYQYNTDEALRKFSSKVFSINYDNKAPVVETSGDYYKISSKVANSYGEYTFGTAVNEAGANGYVQSGFARTVFYFTKETHIFDSSIAKGDAGNKVLTEGLLNKNGLYWKTYTVTNVSGSTITISNSDVNIHKGGLVLLGGAYYKVESIDSTDNKVINLNKNPASSLIDSPVYFAIGHVVDEDDDNVSKGVSRTIWSGSIDSNNLPDGPAVLNYVVFDAAGNYTEQTLEVLVGNNAPRLASVRIWSDFNGNNAEDSADETKYYYYSERNRTIGGTKVLRASAATNNLTVGTDSNPFMIVKDKVTFIPEIVGGNGALYYSYKLGNNPQVDVTTSFGNGHDDGNLYEAEDGTYILTDDNGEIYINGHTKYDSDSNNTDDTEYKFEVSGSQLAGFDGPEKFSFTIWDSAEDSTKFNSSKCLSATMDVVVNVKYNDTTAPNVNVKPFFYNSATDNSIYRKGTHNDYRDFKGHIELEADLTDAIKTTSVTTAAYTTDTELGSDPKVSGIITIRGTAFDDIRLKELKIEFTDHSKIGDGVTAATYSGGVWTSSSAETGTNITTNGWTFTATDRYNNESGHLVDWECNLDTSFITNVAELDRVFTITAVDERGTVVSSTADGCASTNDADYDLTKEADTVHCPTYQMDVVPYIARINTSLSSIESDNPSVYDRSALGHYSTYDTEVVQIVGFNLAANNADVDLNLGTTTEITASGLYVKEINGIPTLNNVNKKVSYNLRHNGVNNDKLTDDVYIDIWQINGTAVTPVDNQILNMNMMINQQNGLIGYGFNNGTYTWSMPHGNTSNAKYAKVQDFTRCSSFTYDALGNSYGAFLPGTDGRGYYFYTSRWYDTAPNITDWNENTKISIGNNTYDGVQDKERYQGASYATLVDENNRTCLYMLVFDQLKNCLTLKYGYVLSRAYEGSLQDIDVVISSNTDANFQKPSEYCAIGVTQSGENGKHYVVITWYDGEKLMYAYKSFTYTADTYKITPGSEAWTVKTDLMLKGGKYCKLAMDNNNGVHIAAYDTEGLNLNYIYIDRVDANSADAVIKKSVVDSYNNVGLDLTIDVAYDSDKGYQIPYISYSGTYPKRPHYAYLADPEAFYTSTSGLDGTDNDKYTGIWECSIVPSPNTFFEDPYSPQRMCVGVWKKSTSLKKNASGELTTSPGTAGYGNGTANAVIAYLRENKANAASNYVETAQLK